ncbi:abortive phage infection protein [Streptomyces sp. NPDC047525]|uniref:abortive phage infection protein n=1 Tax=Streptomyces sp. NPDC047525 TaxID=3155264 RepID=UPI0033E47445
MASGGINRARFLAGAGAVGVAAAAGGLLAAAPAVADGRRTGGLTYRGVCYEVGAGETPTTGWNAARMREDMCAIADRLHATTVSVFGDGVERLGASATEAAERGLHVWLQPRLADRPEREILDHIAETGRHAERLRRQGAAVQLSVGCEFVLFVPGIVPGDSAVERIENITKGNFDPVLMQRRLKRFIGRAAAVGRSVFGGGLTYGAAEGDEVDWGLFDVVSVNYYGYHRSRSGYVRDLAPYRRWGKPVAITEFGTCTFRGAPEQGGMGWDVVDYTKDPPEIKDGLVRSERTQAAYITDVLDVFESMDLYSATLYNFVSPDAPHRPDPRHDLDMASYSIVKTIEEGPSGRWHWEPKEAFHAVAEHYGRAARHAESG